jgi:hypothetical protein
LHGNYVCVARNGVVVSEVPLRSLMRLGSFARRKSALNGALFLSHYNCFKSSDLVAHYSSYPKQS